MTTKKAAGVPSTERIWVTQKSVSGDTYYITSKQDKRDMYYIYKLIDGKAVKLGKNKNPNVLTEQFVE